MCVRGVGALWVERTKAMFSFYEGYRYPITRYRVRSEGVKATASAAALTPQIQSEARR